MSLDEVVRVPTEILTCDGCVFAGELRCDRPEELTECFDMDSGQQYVYVEEGKEGL